MTAIKSLRSNAVKANRQGIVEHLYFSTVPIGPEPLQAELKGSNRSTRIYNSYICKIDNDRYIARIKNTFSSQAPLKGIIGEALNTLVANKLGFKSHNLEMLTFNLLSLQATAYFKKILDKQPLDQVLNDYKDIDITPVITSVLTEFAALSMLGLYHGDMNSSNVFCSFDGNTIKDIEVIDFELAMPSTCDNQLCFVYMCASIYDWRINTLISETEIKTIIKEVLRSTFASIKPESEKAISLFISNRPLSKKLRQLRMSTINPEGKSLISYL